MSLEIYFFGLISFIGDVKKTDAVLVSYPDHRPEIVTADDSTTAHDGRHVVFDGVPGGGATPSPDFKAYVPQLSKLITQKGYNLKSTVVQGTDNGSVHAFVKLPAGDLHVADLYETMGEFKLAGDIVRPGGCIGRLAYMTVFPDSNVFVIGGERQLTLPRDGWVLIRIPAHTEVKTSKLTA